MKDQELEKTNKKILDNAQKKGAPNRVVIERALRRFYKSYKTCTNDEERVGEDRAAYNFINTIFPDDLASRQIFLDYYESCKKKRMETKISDLGEIIYEI